ncbi:MAG: DNA repair protein RadA [Taibaiella sp.]|nr:DNA repair protein RadA [Taibaiella sp.]
MCAKVKTAFFCQNCGYESVKWTGKCPSCNMWNTFVEEKIDTGKANPAEQIWTDQKTDSKRSVLLQEVVTEEEQRWVSPDVELNRTLGGGLVPGSAILAAGEPGIGKSTLFLQCAMNWPQVKTLYVSGEESIHQIKLRSERIGSAHPNLYLLTATDTHTIFQEIKNIRPNWVIIDSIQTLSSPYIESATGSVSQVRECAAELQRFAKQTNTPVVIIGHITKEGSIAGPKILEHMVDTVLQFEGDRHFTYRILRTLKNRFGSTSEIGIYEMTQSGMRPVPNPSEILISHNDASLSGIAIGASIEGARPLMVETQALVSQAVYGTPQRTTNGFDLRRLQLLLAVLDKRGGFQFGSKDVFLNITGGIRIEDPALDLTVACALLSSYHDLPLPEKVCVIGEVGLSGEIRAVNRIDQRISEAAKLGMEYVVIPKASLKGLDTQKTGVTIRSAAKVSDVYEMLFGK